MLAISPRTIKTVVRILNRNHIPLTIDLIQFATNNVAKLTLVLTLKNWAVNQFSFILKIMAIIISLMIFNSLMEHYGGDKLLIRILRPFLKPLGLPSSTAFLWIVANTIGLAYGSGIILANQAEKKLSLSDIKLLNVSIATCHSLLEDTLLFVAIGASMPWIVLPRLLIAALAAHIYNTFVLSKA